MAKIHSIPDVHLLASQTEIAPPEQQAEDKTSSSEKKRRWQKIRSIPGETPAQPPSTSLEKEVAREARGLGIRHGHRPVRRRVHVRLRKQWWFGLVDRLVWASQQEIHRERRRIVRGAHSLLWLASGGHKCHDEEDFGPKRRRAYATTCHVDDHVG